MSTIDGASTRYPIRFEHWYAALSTVLGLPPSRAYVEVSDTEIECRMGWSFHARFPRAAVKGVEPQRGRPLSRGVHGFGGRWLVNGAGQGIVVLTLDPPQRARMLGLPVRLQQLLVSVEEPEALIARLRAR